MPEVTLRPWSDGDRGLLAAANAPEMTEYLGGPETDAELDARLERYRRLHREGTARMFVVERDGEVAGGIGWWPLDEGRVETGWFTLPSMQNRGVARAALALIVDDAVTHSTASELVAFPSVSHGPSNELCRGAGFTLRREEDFPFRGTVLRVNEWSLDLATRRQPAEDPAEPGEPDDGHIGGAHPSARRRFARSALVIGALGVVFGDIGTSPIYTIQTIFNPADPHPVPVSTDNVYGIVSLIFWSVTIIVTIAYVGLILRADNNGEGGIMALLTLVGKKTVAGRRRTKVILVALGIFGASLFFGDSMITPAISVLSAVEGVQIAAPALARFVIPITIAIIVVLFLAQRLGTAAVSRLFGPVMVVWFAAIGALGIGGIAREPEILLALSPTYALQFAISQPGIAFFALAAVVLAITGAEALFADLGHFGRIPIARAWLILVFPTCILSYFGQGALVLQDRDALSSPFFLLIPPPLQIPMVLLATAATVIASQAVITGAFSVARQAVQLGYLPRLRIEHTSARTIGQIYVPLVNWMLLIAVIVLVLSFRSSAALAYAFGMAVTGTIIITTALFLYYARESWKAPLWLLILGGSILMTLEGLFFAANLTKLVSGAWLPLAIAVVVFTILTTWYRGRQIVTAQREREEGPLKQFLEALHDGTIPVTRVPGTGIYLNRGAATTPLAMRSTVEHLGSLHDKVIILSIETAQTPTVPPERRLKVDPLEYSDDGIALVEATFGYMDRPDIPDSLALLEPDALEFPLELDTASYFLSTIDLHRGNTPGLAAWRKPLFLATARGAADAAQYFDLPPDRTILMGSRVEV